MRRGFVFLKLGYPICPKIFFTLVFCISIVPSYVVSSGFLCDLYISRVLPLSLNIFRFDFLYQILLFVLFKKFKVIKKIKYNMIYYIK
jgi:hypothetical protein